MITERRFASAHHGFWDELLPMGEHFIRHVNHGLARFDPPLATSPSPRLNGLVNELAFRLFARSHREEVSVTDLTPAVIDQEAERATQFIENFRQHGRGRVPIPRDPEIHDAKALAGSITAFFSRATTAPLLIQPHFAGCGWVSECDGDVFSSDVLYELKAGARRFRMLDVKQVLIYCALNFAAKSYDIREVCLVNPRQGMYFSEPLTGLCERIAGRTAIEVLGDIVEYVSDADDEYGGA